eukprot:6198362-Pleurochrysis_carterae.AAC.1
MCSASRTVRSPPGVSGGGSTTPSATRISSGDESEIAARSRDRGVISPPMRPPVATSTAVVLRVSRRAASCETYKITPFLRCSVPFERAWARLCACIAAQ